MKKVENRGLRIEDRTSPFASARLLSALTGAIVHLLSSILGYRPILHPRLPTVENRRWKMEDRQAQTVRHLGFSVIDPLSSILHSRLCIGVLLFAVATAGCRQQMAEQPRYDPLEASEFFPDGQSARLLVEGTVARGTLGDDEHLYAGISGGAPAGTFPFPITLDVLERGRERYDIYCSPCHSRTGYGDGMIARRGFGPPASLHTDILRKQPPGHFFRVITQGFGAMPSYRQQIAPEDRWAIIAYIRALQLSQNASPNEVPPEARAQLNQGSR